MTYAHGTLASMKRARNHCNSSNQRTCTICEYNPEKRCCNQTSKTPLITREVRCAHNMGTSYCCIWTIYDIINLLNK